MNNYYFAKVEINHGIEKKDSLENSSYETELKIYKKYSYQEIVMNYLIKSKLNPNKEGFLEAIVLEFKDGLRVEKSNISIKINSENLLKIRERTSGRSIHYPRDLLTI